MAKIQKEILIASANRHLGGLPGVSVAPHIPERKLKNARAAHALHLGPDEPILVLYDATVLGGGDEGFLATPSQLCWRSFLEHPRRILWDDLADVSLTAVDRHVLIRHGEVQTPWTEGAAARVRDFLAECGRRARGGAAPYRDPGREDLDASLGETILKLARHGFGELGFIHYAPSIPPKMLAKVRAVHARALHPAEEIIVLYDDTLFGSGTDGLLFAERHLCWRTFLGDAAAIAWQDLDFDRIAWDGPLLLLPDHRPIDLQNHPGMASLVADVLRKLAHAPALRARRRA